jgi:N-acetylglucosamine malate deacetylase 2
MQPEETESLPPTKTTHILLKLLGSALALFGLFILGIILLRLVYLEQGVPKITLTDWATDNKVKKVLFVYAHQDDELLIAGTAAGLNANGVEAAILTLTNGDGANSDRERAGQTVEQLIAQRRSELAGSSRALGIDEVHQGFFSDAGFMEVPDASVKKVILQLINEFQPDTIITWDTEKGLYGHPHHVRVARLAIEICKEYAGNKAFPVKAVYGNTLSVWLREILKRSSPIFQRRYYEISPNESIEPEFSLATKEFSESRKQAFAVYEETRGPVLSLNPLAGQPAWLQNFVFDREYFYRAY